MREKIYFIPGFMCDVTLWEGIWPHLIHSYEPIHIPIPDKASVVDAADLINEFVLEDNIPLVGFSFGGYIASAFAARYPDRIGKLFVISDSLCKLPDDEIIIRKKAISWITKNGYAGTTK